MNIIYENRFFHRCQEFDQLPLSQLKKKQNPEGTPG